LKTDLVNISHSYSDSLARALSLSLSHSIVHLFFELNYEIANESVYKKRIKEEKSNQILPKQEAK
jgi:hypothetical protein